MNTSIIQTNVRCGMRGTPARLWKLTEAEGAEQVEPVRYRCSSCHQEWKQEDFSGGQELDTVSCSNCYSSNVRIVAVKLIFLEEKDFR